MVVLDHFYNKISNLKYPDPSEILCQMGSPAEADMMRILALHDLNRNQKNSFDCDYRMRFSYTKGWCFYNGLFEENWTCPTVKNLLSQRLITLYEQNPFAISYSMQAPYHNATNYLPILFKKNGDKINLDGGELYDLIKVAANIALPITDILPLSSLKQQFFYLNHGDISQKEGITFSIS